MSDDTTPLARERAELAKFQDQDVVLDTRGELVYLGKLKTIGEWYFELADADVHDVNSARTSKEVYIMESAKYGLKRNRHSVHVRKSEVISLSLVSEIVEY